MNDHRTPAPLGVRSTLATAATVVALATAGVFAQPVPAIVGLVPASAATATPHSPVSMAVVTTSMQIRQLPPTTDTSHPRAAQTFVCDPNHLTAYTGVVQNYVRDTKRTMIVVHTDWDTTQALNIAHTEPTADRAIDMFRIDGRAFTPDDWPRIEQSPGVLRAGTRATIWACDNGKTMVEWNLPSEVR